jgi:hypothetical protein
VLLLKKIVARLLIPLFGLNLAGLGVGVVWLVSQGQAQVIWLGVMMLIFSPFIIPILLIPAGVFSHYMAFYSSVGKKDRERLMFLLSLGYIILFLTFWCTGIFEYVTHNIARQAIAAGLLWASATALAPLLWWSGRDVNNFFIVMMVEVTQVAMIALSVVRLLAGESPFWLSAGVFGGFLVFVAALQSVYEKKFMDDAEAKPH